MVIFQRDGTVRIDGKVMNDTRMQVEDERLNRQGSEET